MNDNLRNKTTVGKFEKIVGLIFILTLITGLLRKWVYVSGLIGNIILGFQLCVPYLLLFSGKNYKKPWSFDLIGIFSILLIALAINPMNLTFFHGALGFILHYSFWFSLSYYLGNRNKINFRPLIPIFLIGCFIEIILGFIQYQLPANHWLNTYANLDAVGGSVALVGESVRVTGTFSYISGFTAFVSFIILFVWYLFRISYNYSIIAILYLGGLLASFMSGSRQAVGVYLIISILILYSEFTSRTIVIFLQKLILPAITIFLLFFIIEKRGFEEKVITAFDNFQERRNVNSESGEENRRLLWDLNDVINFRGNYPIFGVGLGSTYQGATSIFGTSDYVKEYGYSENELPRIVLEGGFILFTFRLLLVIYFMSILNVNIPSKVILGVLIFYFIPVVFNIYNNIFLMIVFMLIDDGQKKLV